MLRRAEGMNAWRLWTTDREGMAAIGRRALRGCALAGATALLCRLQTARGLAPFATAFLAAALAEGRDAAALLIGCLAGAFNGPAGFNLRLPVGAAVVLGGGIAWDALGPALSGARLRGALARPARRPARDPAPRMQARSPNDRVAACAALAGAGVLLPGLWGLGEAVWPEAAAVAAASVAAVAAAPFLCAALSAGLRRRWLEPEERAGLWLLEGLAVAALARWSAPAALCAGGALAMLQYPAGALAGAGVGGALLAVGNGEALLAVSVGVGATAQLCATLSRPARAASACVAGLAVGLLSGASPALLTAVAGASVLAAAAPRPWAEALERLARPAPTGDDPARLVARLGRRSAARLRALGAAFGALADGYRVPGALPDEQALTRRLRGKLCAGCAGYGACWDGGGEGGARLLCDLIARAVALSGEEPLFDSEAPPELTRRCRRGRLIPERLQEELEDYARRRRIALRRGEENRLISAQFDQARRMLAGLADRQSDPARPRARQGARAAAALERAGIPVDAATAWGGRGVEIVATLRRGHWTGEMAALASKGLAGAFGRAYAVAGFCGREARFVRRPRLRADVGVACAARQAEAPSGDSHLICMLDDERLLAVISDGMGSGDDAARESAVAVRLLGRFLRAGAPCTLALETVNALLLNRGGDDMFATVDLLVLNLSTGEAVFSKLAACPTLLVSGGQARRIEGGRLPLGILERVRPGVQTARLAPGDALLMASDGVTDAAGGAALEALMLSDDADARRVARRAIALAEAGGDPRRRDDMTAVCLRIATRYPPEAP